MSGDVQPRKRKDKKKKKGIEEPRGTAAVLGEGDVFIHSHHDHGTGGHWCAKIIFFSLLAVLVTLIGLIILENRGLTELEANAVESRYSGVLEGWLEDAPEDDHHDEHTLELKHHDDDDDHTDENDLGENDDDNNNDDEHDEDDNSDIDNDDADHNDNEEDQQDDEDSQEQDLDTADDEDSQEQDLDTADDEDSQEQDLNTADDEDENEKHIFSKYFGHDDDDDNDDQTDNDDDDQHQPDEDNDEADENNTEEDADNNDEQDDDNLSKDLTDNDEADDKSLEDANNNESNDWENSHERDDEDEDEQEEQEDELDVEVERIEREDSEEETVSTELPALPETDDDSADVENIPKVDPLEKLDDETDEFLENDDEEPPIVEHVSAPAGQPFTEVEDVSTERPSDTLADEEEYEKRQEELRREREQASHKDGGNSIDEWPGEPSDAYWRQELDRAEQELRQGKWTRAAERAQAAGLDGSGRARWIAAVATDRAAEAHRDNRLLTRAIAAYLRLLEMNERLSNDKLIEIANRTLDRIQFRGNYLAAEPVYRLLIRRFPDDITFRNNLSVTFLMANRADLAGEVLKETLKRWPNDRIALAHYGFVLKTHYNQLTEAVDYFQRALEDDIGPATEPRFYYHLGDSLLLLGRHTEAHEVHKRAAAHGHFLSAAQRSLYNVPRLRSRPWWNIEDTPYVKLARTLEKSWREILKEGEAAQALYEQEKEGLRERGEWSQLDLFVRGKEIPGRCAKAPVTCAAVRHEPAAAGCRRGQVKFSAMAAGTHVRPHVGPTNCRLRMHLALTNTKDTYIRVDRETRQWQVGKTFLFDDSFEHEVWHNGTGTRLVLIVDVWHPDLTLAERRSLPAI